MLKRLIEDLDYILIYVIGFYLGFKFTKSFYEYQLSELSSMIVFYLQIALIILLYIRIRLQQKQVSKNDVSELQQSHNHHPS